MTHGAIAVTPLHTARKIARSLILPLQSSNNVIRVSAVGSVRRWVPAVGGIDILAAVNHSVKAQEEIKRDFASMGTRAVFKQHTVTMVTESGIRARLHLCGERTWGANLIYHTGSEDHGRFVGRTLASFDLVLDPTSGLRRRTGEPLLQVQSEREIYASGYLPYFPPECRDHNAVPPGLFDPRVYRSDYCVRTTYSGGSGSPRSCLERASALGLHTVAIADRMDMVSDPRAYLSDVTAMKNEFPGIRTYCTLDLPVGLDGWVPEVPGSSRLDWLQISLYREPDHQPELRILSALELDSRIRVVHGAPVAGTASWKRVFHELARRGVALCVDPRPANEVRVDGLRSARAAGVRFVLGSGACNVNRIQSVVYAEKRARRALLTTEDFAWTPKQS